MLSHRQVILKFILSTGAKKHKLAYAQTYAFLYAPANKINFESLRLVQMHFTQYILLLAFYKKKEVFANFIFLLPNCENTNALLII